MLVEFGQLRHGPAAAGASVEVSLQIPIAPSAGTAYGGCEETAEVPALRLVRGLDGLDVCGEVRLAQALAGTSSKGADAAGADTEECADLFGRLALDDGVPQHRLPAFRKGAEAAYEKGIVLLAQDA